jgi:hypothetical protein
MNEFVEPLAVEYAAEKEAENNPIPVVNDVKEN